MPLYHVYAWHFLTEGWEDRNKALARVARRPANTNCAGSGVYELVWDCHTTIEAEELRDMLRAVAGVTVGLNWYAGLDKHRKG